MHGKASTWTVPGSVGYLCTYLRIFGSCWLFFWLLTLQSLLCSNISWTGKTDPSYTHHINLSHPIPWEKGGSTHSPQMNQYALQRQHTPLLLPCSQKHTVSLVTFRSQRSHNFHTFHCMRPWKELFCNYQHPPSLPGTSTMPSPIFCVCAWSVPLTLRYNRHLFYCITLASTQTQTVALMMRVAHFSQAMVNHFTWYTNPNHHYHLGKTSWAPCHDSQP